ncbi:BTAD domain-containing putative transcriptional regulator [Nocardioides speluncae]|uniref:BTAD domain-containing putative transcriptional regulator n=1 Tax=Nocardioides speluncae TaxID=2670337 RepID=UPI001379FD6A|nr:BTAD domain-containing putative transcriptional regulator [Nocardioides speluncae]
MAGAGRIELRLLGRFAVLRDGVEIPPAAFAGRKVRTLLKVLACRQGRFVSNDTLAEALWPTKPPSDPVANLQVLVNRARRALGDAALIVTDRGGYTLVRSAACSVDSERFLDALSDRSLSAPGLQEALSLWQGEPLPEEAYDDWAVGYRARLLRAHQDALERAALLAMEDGAAGTAVELASRAVEAEPLREIAVLTLIRALAAAGDGAAALQVYDDYRRALADELGVDPSAEAVALHQSLLRQAPPPDQAPRRRWSREFAELPFVGRGAELRKIRTALTEAAGRRVFVAISGPSGAGKSRLLDSLAREVPMVRARAHPSERSEPWTLLRTLLREVAAQDIAHVDRLPPPMASALAWLLPEHDGRGGADLDPESRRILLHEASLRLLEAAGVIAVDDLQWCDPSSLGVLEAATARIANLRTVLAYRPEEVADRDDVRAFVGRANCVLRVDLGALPDESLPQLVADSGVVEALRQHTDRTPMAVAEVLRALSAEGLVAPAPEGAWQSSGDAAARAVALAREGQRLAIHARAAAQRDADRELLALLALVARETNASTLAAATATPEPQVLDSLSRLFRSGLAQLGDQGWSTSHDMVTEVVSSGLDIVERARLHASLARALRSEDDPLLLAHHLREAGDSRGAADAYAVAAQRAFDTVADDEAAQLAGVGLGLSPTAAVRAELQEIRGQARQRLGDYAGAREDLRSALAVHTSGPARARVLARLAMVSSGAEDIVRAAQLAELAVVEAGEDAPIRARALEVASVLDMNLERGRRSAERASEALGLYESLGDANGMARILDARAMAQFLEGDVRGGEAALRRVADLFEDSGDLVRVVTPRATAGHALVFAGHPEQGLVQVTAALELARTLGHPEGQAYTLWHRTEALAALDRGEEAAAEAAEALAIATRIGHRGWTATGWRAVGLAAQQRGELDEALQAFRRSLDLSEHLGLFASWAAARAAMVLVSQGRPEPAVPLVARALREGPPLGHYEARWAQVELAVALGDAAAPALAQAACDLLKAGGVQQARERLLAVAATYSD